MCKLHRKTRAQVRVSAAGVTADPKTEKTTIQWAYWDTQRRVWPVRKPALPTSLRGKPGKLNCWESVLWPLLHQSYLCFTPVHDSRILLWLFYVVRVPIAFYLLPQKRWSTGTGGATKVSDKYSNLINRVQWRNPKMTLTTETNAKNVTHWDLRRT